MGTKATAAVVERPTAEQIAEVAEKPFSEYEALRRGQEKTARHPAQG